MKHIVYLNAEECDMYAGSCKGKVLDDKIVMYWGQPHKKVLISSEELKEVKKGRGINLVSPTKDDSGRTHYVTLKDIAVLMGFSKGTDWNKRHKKTIKAYPQPCSDHGCSYKPTDIVNKQPRCPLHR